MTLAERILAREKETKEFALKGFQFPSYPSEPEINLTLLLLPEYISYLAHKIKQCHCGKACGKSGFCRKHYYHNWYMAHKHPVDSRIK